MKESHAYDANLRSGSMRLGRPFLLPVVQADGTHDKGLVTCGGRQVHEVGLKTILRLKIGSAANDIKTTRT